jgi:hypothetical protein
MKTVCEINSLRLLGLLEQFNVEQVIVLLQANFRQETVDLGKAD